MISELVWCYESSIAPAMSLGSVLNLVGSEQGFPVRKEKKPLKTTSICFKLDGLLSTFTKFSFKYLLTL